MPAREPMNVLGIESSCDETACAIVSDGGLVRADVVESQAVHSAHGGIVPELASRDHTRNVVPVVGAALTSAGLSLRDIDLVAVTARPGLVGALLVGVQAAKGLAWAAGKPLVGVDHLLGHLLAVFLRREGAPAAAPRFPFVALVASGGHTALYRVSAPTAEACEELGATRDDAAGECFDKVAKLLGLGYPGGPLIDRLAAGGDATRYPLSAPMRSAASLEFSFSGLKSRVARDLEQHGPPTGPQGLADYCASFQAAVTSVLADKLTTAALREGVEDVVLAGGVAANSELRRRVGELAAQRGLVAHVPPIRSCTDNAAMIAYAGLMAAERGTVADWSLEATSVTALPRATRKGRGQR